MSIPTIDADNVASAVEAINAFRFSSEFSTLPEPVRERLISASREMSPVSCICQTLETLWGARSSLGVDARDLAAQLALFVAPFGWWGFGADGRAVKIARAMRHDAGEEVPGYDADDDPAVSPGYAFEAPGV